MKVRSGKGLKPIFLRFAALLMGICYLLNPLQQPVFETIHTISHVFGLPENIISHNDGHIENIGIHKSVHHHNGELNHDHELIDLVKSIFKASHENDQTHSETFVKVKCDKHLVSNTFFSINSTFVSKMNYYPLLIEDLRKGYVNNWWEPPQNTYPKFPPQTFTGI